MYDLAIIGAGAAGIACAKSAIGNKLHTVLIEERQETFGGTCLNKGCIPTKFFLNSSKLHKSWQDLSGEKDNIIKKVKMPLLRYLEGQGVDILWGEASFLDKNSLSVDGARVEAKNIIVATGSSAKTLPGYPNTIPAEDLFSQPVLPERILIVGAGYIGIEFASLLHNLGKDICVIEKEKTILPGFNYYFSRRLRTILEKKGIKIEIGKDISGCNLDNFDLLISAIGRQPNLQKLKIENAGLMQNQEGWIKTNEYMETNVKSIYACGDTTGKKLLAYTAEYQARICIDNIRGETAEEDYFGLPECVFSMPQMAKVGILEEEAKQRNIKYRVIKSNFLKFSSTYVYGDSDGYIEIVLDSQEKIIGAGIISHLAGELINTFSLCLNSNLTLGDLKKCVFIHPTLSEIIPLVSEDGGRLSAS